MTTLSPVKEGFGWYVQTGFLMKKTVFIPKPAR
jgi:hypothetical protein